MATYLARSCPRCNSYLGIVLREPGRNVRVRAVNGHCLKGDYRLAWIVIKGKQAAKQQSVRRQVVGPKKKHSTNSHRPANSFLIFALEIPNAKRLYDVAVAAGIQTGS
jgi:hypothetical protein